MNSSDCNFIKSVFTWDSGGGIEVDLVELDDGTALIISDDSIVLYNNLEAAQSGEPRDGESSIYRI